MGWLDEAPTRGTYSTTRINPLLWDPFGTLNAPTTSSAPAPDITTITGVDPAELPNITWGRKIPVFAGGLARMGAAGMVFGPYIENGMASFGVSFGFPANPSGTRVLREISFDSLLAWDDPTGVSGPTTPSFGFVGEAFTFRWYPGTLTQAVDPLETLRFPSEAIAYRPQMLLFFENLPLARFGYKIPFVAAKIGDTTLGAVPEDGINLGTALERIAASPWVDMDSSMFETDGITDVVDAVIVAENTSFLEFIRNLSRVYCTLDILQTDKLRINDRGNDLAADLVFTRDNIINDVTYTRADPKSLPRELQLITPDPDADYSLVTSKAEHPRDPVNVSSSVGKEDITLPVVIDSNTRMSLVTYLLYKEENARKKASFLAPHFALEIEPGDIFQLTGIGDGLEDEDYKVLETSHNGNWTVNIVGEAILKCALPAIPGDPVVPGTILTGATGAWSASRILIDGYVGDRYHLTASRVDTLYDQTGNLRHFAQATTGRRPLIVNAGPLNRPALDFLGGVTLTRLLNTATLDDFINANLGYMCVSFYADTFTLNQGVAALNDVILTDTNLFAGTTVKSGGTVFSFNFDANYDTASTVGLSTATPYVVEWRHEGGLLYQRTNMGVEVSTPSGNTTVLTNLLQMGGSLSGQSFDGKIFEAITYDTALGSAERDAIAANFMSWIGAT